MDVMRNVVDLSSFVLWEASGDSEADSDINGDVLMSVVDVADMSDEDDAQSCICDPSENNWENMFDRFDGDPISVFLENGGCRNDYGENEVSDATVVAEDEEDGVIDQRFCGDKVSFPNIGRRKKTEDYSDPKTGALSQRDEDKLFWDACLAS